ncbi:ABC transporter ATP-binding protein [Mahella australiensis]|uniref:ABC transporter related protein n=1 Tax=Mahella australiensis (strain DSM 15567 / CIP 107919 / 50-1 BON) TaxID=697281 RepID=F3ZXH8_MAHA5|nr:ATP-binding cassette domain-containing protein [Mahella australiensis]AEE97659.1 ABC transporter related protein [Mahella australiensis 50-1 BON]
MAIIEVKNLYKEFKVYKRNSGFFDTVKSLFHREFEIKRAVEDVSFSVAKGELVGYIGPNGAGKSTTIKILTGILYPTSGEVLVRGIVPQKNRKENAMHIGVVFGQRSQLYWDLPMIDTFDLYKKMYKIDDKIFKQNVDFYTDILDMGEFINRPIRQLSLGQKMRAEFSIALLHNPDILYLDEPTIGLDVLTKKRIREFIRQINKERQTTVILTTHDMDDIEQICDRLILIDKGKILYDGKVEEFKTNFSEESIIEFSYGQKYGSDDKDILEVEGIKLSDGENSKKYASFNKKQYTAAQVIRMLMGIYDIIDFSIKDPKIEDILIKMYTTVGNRGGDNQ